VPLLPLQPFLPVRPLVPVQPLLPFQPFAPVGPGPGPGPGAELMRAELSAEDVAALEQFIVESEQPPEL
jgi:hypothetical protein